MTLDVLTADAAGWIAAMLTACCFASTRMLRLRALALMANLAFIAYGSLAGLLPVLALHLMLAPLNAWHLARQWRAARAAVEAGRHKAAPPVTAHVQRNAGAAPACAGSQGDRVRRYAHADGPAPACAADRA